MDPLSVRNLLAATRRLCHLLLIGRGDDGQVGSVQSLSCRTMKEVIIKFEPGQISRGLANGIFMLEGRALND